VRGRGAGAAQTQQRAGELTVALVDHRVQGHVQISAHAVGHLEARRLAAFGQRDTGGNVLRQQPAPRHLLVPPEHGQVQAQPGSVPGRQRQLPISQLEHELARHVRQERNGPDPDQDRQSCRRLLAGTLAPASPVLPVSDQRAGGPRYGGQCLLVAPGAQQSHAVVRVGMGTTHAACSAVGRLVAGGALRN